MCTATDTDVFECMSLEFVSSIKYLGLQIDSRLKWKMHINFILPTKKELNENDFFSADMPNDVVGRI